MAFLSGMYRCEDTFADVSGNRLPFSRRLKIAEVEIHISQGLYWGSPSLFPYFQSW